MKTRSKVLLSLVLSFSLVFAQLFSYPVLADEYIVSGNGEGSSNNVNVEQKSSDSVSQSNSAEIKNEVKPEADSGGNSASGNSGDSTGVTTGNAAANTSVQNSGNVNSASGECCPQSNETSAKVVDNGAGSSNSINSGSGSNTTVTQNNGAKITNNISVAANTGDNSASGNSGDVSIQTGDVNISGRVINKNLNTSFIAYSKPDPGFNLVIAGNGDGSVNQINNNAALDQKFLVNNYLELNNNIVAYANTGGNKAKGNNGKVFISTGNVLLDIILKNEGNNSQVIADCGCKSPVPSPTPSPSGTPNPTTPPSGGGGNGNGGGSGGSSGESGSSSASSGSGGQVLGVMLPATGGISVLSLTIVAFILLSLGIILRLDYGKAKSYLQYLNFEFVAPAAFYLYTYFANVHFARQAALERRRAFYFYSQDFSLRPAY